jgi:hypothetical protein
VWHLTLPKTLRVENRLDPKDAYLFHHYISHVVPLMTPFHSSRNPWLKYPAVALHQSYNGGQNHLLHALMSLAAIYISNTGGDPLVMSSLGINLYSRAMAELRSCLDNGSAEYLDSLMTMMIFLFIEVSGFRHTSWAVCTEELTRLKAIPRQF